VNIEPTNWGRRLTREKAAGCYLPRAFPSAVAALLASIVESKANSVTHLLPTAEAETLRTLIPAKAI